MKINADSVGIAELSKIKLVESLMKTGLIMALCGIVVTGTGFILMNKTQEWTFCGETSDTIKTLVDIKKLLHSDFYS